MTPPTMIPAPRARRTLRPAVAALAISGALLLAGCSGSTTTGGDATPDASTATSAPASPQASESTAASPQTTPATTAAGSTTASPATTPAGGKEVYKGVKVAGGKGETPTITLADNFDSVAVLHTIDLYQGEGDPVVDGSTVTVNYVGMGADSRTVFDSSYERGAPATFPLSKVIEGWSEGLIGMQPGGRRVLIIPGDMAYGAAGYPPNIGPDETLVFVVDMLQTTTATPSAG